MELLTFVSHMTVLVTMVSGEGFTREQLKLLSLKNIPILQRDFQKGQVICDRLSRHPYFGFEVLLKQPWMIYYSWNMDFENNCLEMRFRNATLKAVIRIYNQMSEFLETDPNWDAPAVLVTLGKARQELVLFADQGLAGRFQGVPNVMADDSSILIKRIPLLSFHLKLIYGGKYLLMADCQTGVTTLSTRRFRTPHRAEIGGIASNLNIGPGNYTCQSH